MRVSTVSPDKRTETVVEYYREFRWRDDPSGGFSFDCDADGNLDPDKSEAASANYASCLSGEYDVEDLGVRRSEQEFRLCPCGSGEHPDDLYDARGIYVSKVCSKCEGGVRGKYRSEIFSNPSYDTYGECVDEEY